MPTLAQSVKQVAYEDVELLVYKTARDVWRRCGGDIEELLSEARYLFCVAYDSHDQEKGELTTWVVWKVRSGLLTLRKKQKRLFREKKVEPEILNTFRKKEKHSFNVKELRPFTRMVVSLALSPPREVKLNALYNGGLSPKMIKKGLFAFLKQMGWPVKKINEAFLEIKEALL